MTPGLRWGGGEGFLSSSFWLQLCSTPPTLSLQGRGSEEAGSVSEHMHCSPLLHSPILTQFLPALLSYPPPPFALSVQKGRGGGVQVGEEGGLGWRERLWTQL